LYDYYKRFLCDVGDQQKLTEHSFLMVKTQAMIRCMDQSLAFLSSHLPELRLNGDLVVYRNQVRHLGMIVDNCIFFQDQTNDIRRWVNFALTRLWHYADVTRVLTRKRLLQSYFIYCDALEGVNRQINVRFISCDRYIYGESRFRKISSFSCMNMITYR
jgi:hypothetical protein